MGDAFAGFLATSPNASARHGSTSRATTLRRMTSTSSSAARRTTTFSDFLSDSDDDDDDDDDQAVDVQRMQQQADDMTYFQDTALGVGSPPLNGGGWSASPDDRSFRLSVAPPGLTAANKVPTPTMQPRNTTTSSARKTFGRLTRSTSTGRKTVGRMTAVRAPAVLRRLTSLKRRKTTTAGGHDDSEDRGTMSDVDGLLLDSDESASERGSQGGSDKLSVYSEHDSSFASNDRSFAGREAVGNDDSFYSNQDDHSFAGRDARNHNDDSFYSKQDDRSFAGREAGNNDDSFYSNQDDRSFVSRGEDRSFHDPTINYQDVEGGEFHDEEVDHSFSSAMTHQPRHSDDDDDDLYDTGGYDAEEEEQRRRDKEAELREQEQEEKEAQMYGHRLSEEPFAQIARASTRMSSRVSVRASVRASTVGGFGEIEENPYASSSFDSIDSSGDHFFVESVRGSSDSIAPLMDLPASPAQFSEISNGSGSAKSSLSSTPSSLQMRNSADLSFRSSFVAVSQQGLPQPGPPTLGVRVVDHTQKKLPPTSPVVPFALTTPTTIRDSSSSSSSSSSDEVMEDTSFSSNIDDSFTERPRSSSEDNLSFVFKNHVTSMSDDPASVADAIAAVDNATASRSRGAQDDSFVSSAAPYLPKDVTTSQGVVANEQQSQGPPVAVSEETPSPAVVLEKKKMLTTVEPPKVTADAEASKPISAVVVEPSKPTPALMPKIPAQAAVPPKPSQAPVPTKPTPIEMPSKPVQPVVPTAVPQATVSPKSTHPEAPPKPAPVVVPPKPTRVEVPQKTAPVVGPSTPAQSTTQPSPTASAIFSKPNDPAAPSAVVSTPLTAPVVPPTVTIVPAVTSTMAVPAVVTKKSTTAALQTVTKPVEVPPMAAPTAAVTPAKTTSVKQQPTKAPQAAGAPPPIIPVKVPPPAKKEAPIVPRDSSAPTDLETRKTKKFTKPLPPGRKRGPPPASVAAAAAVASTAVAATASIVNAVTAGSSPPNANAGIDTSIVSSRPSDTRLDFTGVFLGDAEDANNSKPSKKAGSDAPTKADDPKSSTEPEPAVLPISVKETAAAAAKAGPPSMRRMVSAQEVSERKVEEFFRKTYLENEDDDMSDFMLDSGNTRGRSKTAANRVMASLPITEKPRRDDPMVVSNRSRRSSTSAMKMVDLKHVKGQRIEDLLRANEEESKDDEDDGYSDLAGSEAPARKRTLSRPFPINEDLLEEKFPLRPSTASSIALANRRPAPARPNDEPLTPMTVYSVTSGSEYTASVPDSEVPLNANVIQRNFTLSLASGTVGRSSFSISPQTDDSPNAIPMPPNYMLSPRLENHRPSSSLGSISTDSDSAFSKSASTTPHLPTLTVNTKPVVTATSANAAAASTKLASSGFDASQFSTSGMLRSPNPMAASTGMNEVAPGFRWHPEFSQNQPPQQPTHAPGTKQSHDSAGSSEDGSLGIKESVWHAAGALSIGSARPSMVASVANQFQRASATLKNSFQRIRSQFIPPNRGYDGPTSPTSLVSAPPKLPRGYDDRDFYKRLGNIPCGDGMIVVSKAGRMNSAKEAALAHKRKTLAWLLLLGVLFGIVMGIGMTHIESLSSKFRIVVNEVTGEMTLPVGAKWLLLPGSLFLRIWNCIAMPLLFCQVVNGVAELAMTQKAKTAISFRAIGYMVLTAALTTIEGVGMAMVYRAIGLFSSKQVALRTAAASVKAAVNVTDRVMGMGAMMCAAGETYLQASENGQLWKCSNETIAMPVQAGINITGQNWTGSSSALFVFQELPTVLSASTKSVSAVSASTYYPVTTSSVGDVLSEIIALLSPHNVVDSFSKSIVPSIVVVAVVVGLVIGVRAFHRAITAQHFLQQSQTQHRTKATVMAENILAKPHPVLGVMIEIQQLLEWLAESIQILAPIGVASLLAGHIVVHRDELFGVGAPAVSLILGVIIASVIHILLLSPLLVKLFTGANAWTSLTAFLPSMCLSFGTGNVALSVPVLAQNFASAQIVTKSMSQVGSGLAIAIQRSGNALYYPLAMLFLLDTTTPDGAVPMTAKVVLLLGALTFASCFFAVSPGPKLGLPGVNASAHLQLVLLLFRAWTQQQLSGMATLPLLVVADVIVGHVVALVSTHDHVVVTRLLAEHCAELCIPPSDAAAAGIGASPVYL